MQTNDCSDTRGHASDVPGSDLALRALEARVIALESELAAYRRQMAADRADNDRSSGNRRTVPGAPDTGPRDQGLSGRSDGDGQLGRRQLIGKAGAATAGAVAAATLLSNDPASAAAGTFDGNPAVSATGLFGDGVDGSTNLAGKNGVYGHTSVDGATAITGRNFAIGNAIEGFATGGGTGVFGQSASGLGAFGSATSGIGVSGYATTGHGVRAVSSDGNQGANLYLQASKGDPRGLATPHFAGEVIADTSGGLWFCVGNGNPGSWRRLAAPSTAGSFNVLAAPVRIYDSRPGFPPSTPPKSAMANGETRVLSCSPAGMPGGAVAVFVNLTVTNTSAAGFLGLFAAGVSWPGNSSVNWDRAGATVANSAVVGCNALNQISAYCAGTTNLLIDVMGYWL